MLFLFSDAVTDITYSVKKVSPFPASPSSSLVSRLTVPFSFLLPSMQLIKAGAQHILLYNSLDLGVNTPYALSAPTMAPFLSAWAISFRNEMFKNFPPWGAIGANPYVAVVDIYALANSQSHTRFRRRTERTNRRRTDPRSCCFFAAISPPHLVRAVRIGRFDEGDPLRDWNGGL